jgi:hypothetical protein
LDAIEHRTFFRPDRTKGGTVSIPKGTMMAQFAISTTEGRVFGLDLGDWSMLLGGSVLIALMAMLV